MTKVRYSSAISLWSEVAKQMRCTGTFESTHCRELPTQRMVTSSISISQEGILHIFVRFLLTCGTASTLGVRYSEVFNA
jgi:hypothetical protein